LPFFSGSDGHAVGQPNSRFPSIKFKMTNPRLDEKAPHHSQENEFCLVISSLLSKE
jgi:hypothetical protein